MAEVGDRLTELRNSARGWHGVQLAVLGFIGLCGVLQSGAADDNPWWLQVLAGLLTLLALALACLATALVATAAWPVYGYTDDRDRAADDQEVRRTSRRLRSGIAATFLAVTVLAVAATSSWWPSRSEGSPLVEITTNSARLCGELLPAEPGLVSLQVASRPVVVALQDVQQLQPRASCT